MESNLQYREKDYWNRRFQEEQNFEWLADFQAFKHVILPKLMSSDRILHIGCGSSRLSMELYELGFRNITNVDYSPVLIEASKSRYPEMEWICDDIMSLETIPDASFDVVLEKATLEALLVAEKSQWSPSDEALHMLDSVFSAVQRVLTPQGLLSGKTTNYCRFSANLYQSPSPNLTSVYLLCSGTHHGPWISRNSAKCSISSSTAVAEARPRLRSSAIDFSTLHPNGSAQSHHPKIFPYCYYFCCFLVVQCTVWLTVDDKRNMVEEGEIDQLRTNADNLAKCLHALLQRIESLEMNKGQKDEVASPRSPKEETDFKDEQATIEDSIEVDPVTGLRKRRIVTERVLTTKTFHQLALEPASIPLAPLASGRLLSPVYQSRAVSIDRRQLDQIEVTVSNGQLVVLSVHPSSNHNIHPGDTILQVNGKDISSKEELMNSVGHLEVTLVPSELYLAPSRFYRMLEDYSSEADPAGCRWLPVDFRKGDVIQSMADDGLWKQARKVNDLSRVGYLPSSLAMERVSMLAPYGRRVLVLLGAPGVGRRTLKSMLLRFAPHHFDTIVPITSRQPRRGEIEGKNYYFKRREDVYELIRQGRMIEWGELDNEIYGTSSDTVRDVIRGGRMCCVDCSDKALHYLYNKEFMPFVVHIAPPPLEELIQLEQLRHSRRPADKLAEICTQAEAIANGEFGTKIHCTLINRNLDVTFKRLIDALESLRLDTQWVPEEWMT